MKYRRVQTSGATYFFTVNLLNRRSDLLVRQIHDLRTVVARVKARHPFQTIAMVVLPEHLHALWRLPPGDGDHAKRWSLIKSGFSRCLPKTEAISKSRQGKRERGIWQRRYWEHCIGDEEDLANHLAYIHYNPVKHGLVERAIEWPYSTLHGYVERGWLPADWGGGVETQEGMYGER